jgi:pectate lyase
MFLLRFVSPAALGSNKALPPVPSFPMRRVVTCAVVCGLFALLAPHGAPAALLLEDHFNYPDGNLGASGVGNSVWSAGDSAHSAISVGSAAALDYSGLAGATGSGVVMSGGTFKKKSAPFTSLSGDSNSLYCSFLLNIQAAPSGTALIAWMNSSGGGTGSPGLGIFLNGSQIGLGKRSSSPTATSSALSAGTHLIVARYAFQTGNDRVDLWVDPSPLGNEATNPVVTLTAGTDSSSDVSSLSYFVLNHGISQTLWIDEVRVGATWAEVTPSGAPLVGEKLGFTTQPANAFAGATMNPVVVQVQSAGGASVASNGVAVTLSLSSGSGTLSGTLTQTTDANGQAAFNDLSIDTAGGGKQLTATADGLSSAVSSNFVILAPGAATQLGFTAQPSDTTVNQPITPAVVVQVQDDGGSPVGSNGIPITVTLSGGAGTLGGTTTRDTDSTGKAAFDDLTVDTVGSGKRLTAAATGIDADLTNTVSVAFAIISEAQPPTGGAVITQALVSAGNVVLRGTNGTADGSYQVLSATNLALSPEQWLPLATNTFDAQGNFDCTNPVASTEQSYFRLRCEGTVPPTNELDFSHVGFASTGMDLTGGEGGTGGVGSNTAQLQAATDANGKSIIYVQGTIPVSGMATHIRSHKTIIGLGTDATLDGGGLYMHGGSYGTNASNIIIRNLTIKNSSDDNVGFTTGANHVWVDHCTFYDSADGGVDVVKGSDYVTISWCKFYYTSPGLDHRLVSLVGASDGEGSLDMGKLHVTYHHNWWSTNCDQRMPSVRFGRAHVFNNYYDSPGNLYCIRSRLYAECLVENNYFDNVHNPWEVFVTSAGGDMGKVFATNNVEVNTAYSGGDDGDGNTVVIVPGTDTVFTPPYSYTLDPASSTPNIVTNHAGAGKGPFAP